MYLWNLWHIICIIKYIYILTFFLDLSGICIWHIFCHSFWHSIWYIFGGSLWWGSGGEHSDPELAVDVRQGTLWSGACGGGAAGNTLIQRLLLGSGRERCDLELAVEARRRKEEGGGRKEEGGRRRAGWRKISQPSPDRWGKTEVFQNGTRICYVLSVLPALAAVTFEQHGVA